MLLAAGREVVSKTSAYNITKLSYRVEVRVSSTRLIVFSNLFGSSAHSSITWLQALLPIVSVFNRNSSVSSEADLPVTILKRESLLILSEKGFKFSSTYSTIRRTVTHHNSFVCDFSLNPR